MASNILDFFTGGVFGTFGALVKNFFEYLIRFFTGIVFSLLQPLIDNLLNILPNFDYNAIQIDIVENFFDFVNFVFDMSLMNREVFMLCIGSIGFRLTIFISFYFFKVIVAWWDKIFI